MADLIKKWKAPKNIENMRTIDLNHHIIKVADTFTKRLDQAMFKCHQSMIKAMVPMIKVADLEAKGEFLPAEKKLEKLLHGLRLMAISASRLLQIRREFVRKQLGQKYEGFMAERHPITKLLFGDNLQVEAEKIAQDELMTNLATAGAKASSQDSFFGQKGHGGQSNRGKGRGGQTQQYYQPYKQQGKGRGSQGETEYRSPLRDEQMRPYREREPDKRDNKQSRGRNY